MPDFSDEAGLRLFDLGFLRDRRDGRAGALRWGRRSGGGHHSSARACRRISALVALPMIARCPSFHHRVLSRSSCNTPPYYLNSIF